MEPAETPSVDKPDDSAHGSARTSRAAAEPTTAQTPANETEPATVSSTEIADAQSHAGEAAAPRASANETDAAQSATQTDAQSSADEAAPASTSPSDQDSPRQTRPWYKRGWFKTELILLAAAVLFVLLLFVEKRLPDGMVFVWWLHNTFVGMAAVLVAIQVLVVASLPVIAVVKLWSHFDVASKIPHIIDVIVESLGMLVAVAYALLALGVAGLVGLGFMLSIFEGVPSHSADDPIFERCQEPGIYCKWDAGFLADPDEVHTLVYRESGLLMRHIGVIPSWDVRRSAMEAPADIPDSPSENNPSAPGPGQPIDGADVIDCQDPWILTTRGSDATRLPHYPLNAEPSTNIPQSPMPKSALADDPNTRVFQLPGKDWAILQTTGRYDVFSTYWAFDRGDEWEYFNIVPAVRSIVEIKEDEFGFPILVSQNSNGVRTEWTTFDDGLNWYCYLH